MNNSLNFTNAQRCAMSVTGLRDLAHSLLHPGNSFTSDYNELAEFVARAPLYVGDVPQDAVPIARKRLEAAAGRGNQLAARLLADLDARSAS